MNDLNIRTVAAEEIWKQTTDGFLPVLLEIYNPDIKWKDGTLEQDNMYLRVISDTNAVMYKGKKYLPCKFSYTPPEEDGKSVGQASITISAVDSRVVQMLRSIELQCEVKVMAMFAKRGTETRFYPIEYIRSKLPSATYNRLTAQLTLSYKDVLKLNVPRHIATKDQLPSVDNNA